MRIKTGDNINSSKPANKKSKKGLLILAYKILLFKNAIQD